MRLDISATQLKELYVKQGLSTYAIAEKFDCCQATICKRLHQHKIKPRYPWNAVNLSKSELEKLYIRKKLSTWEIEKRFGYNRSLVHRRLCKYKIRTRNIAQSHIRFPRKNFNGNQFEKAYMIGFAMGDLNVTRVGAQSETTRLKCGSTKEAQITLFKKLFSPYGRVLIGKRTQSGRINAEAFLNHSFYFLLQKRVLADSWITERSGPFFAFLGGFSDAEGSFFINRQGQGFFSLGNYNHSLLQQIKTLLEKYGIPTPSISTDKRMGKVSSRGFIWRNNYHILHCSRMKYLLKLINCLKPYIKHADRRQAMQAVKVNVLARLRFSN